MLRRPPRSTLFPSTPPFRSPVVLVGAGPVHDPPAEDRADRPRVGAMPVGGDLIGRHARGGLGRDRKSTRLNSSHANISYAVFCLKKTIGQLREPHAVELRDG